MGNVENQTVYVYVLDSDGNNVSTIFSFRFYDKNLKFQNGTNVKTGEATLRIDGSKISYFFVNINGGDLIQQEGLYQIVMTTTRITTFPTTYVAPTILGSKTFPIQSVGELYVDEEGESILDDDNNEQYKINIISENHQNLAHGLDIVAGQNCTLTKEGDSYRVKGNGSYLGGIIIKSLPIKAGNTKYVLEFHGKRVKGCTADIIISTTNVVILPDTYYYPEDGILRIEYYTNANGVRDLGLWFSRAVAEDCEYIFSDIKVYEVQDYSEIYKRTAASILLPQPLRGINDKCDSLVWNNETSKYEIIPRVKKLILDDSYSYGTNWAGTTDKYAVFVLNRATVPDLASPNDIRLKNIICDKLPSYDQSLFGGLEANGICITNHPAIYIKVNIEEFGLSSNNDVEGFKTWLRNNGGLEIYYQTTDNTAIETNITKPITIPCYDNTTAIYTSGTSSHDEVNLPPIEELKGEITCTTLPLSTIAYIKPNTQYTMFMNTDCNVNYNLGGIEKEYKPTQGKILITTPSTLSNNTLTLLGEGNIGNVTLLEGDYTNSYVTDKFINDVFSVGDLQEDGSYKIDIISKNKNLFVLSMDSIYDTFYLYNKVSKENAIVIDNEEKTITFNGTDATQGIKVKNRLKKGHAYTIRFKIKWNSGGAGYGIPLVNLVDSLGYKNPNEDSSRLSYSLGIEQDNVYVEVCKTFTLYTDRYLYLQMTTGNRSSSSMTVKDLEIIEGDIIDAKYIEGKEDIISISLPQPLRRVGDVCDRLYWDSIKGKMCIEKNIIPINHAIQKEGINLSYIGSGDGCGEIQYNINGISDLKVNSRIICNKFTSFSSKNELLTEGRAKGVEGIHSNDGGINTVIFSFNRNRVKNLDINTIAQWFADNNVIIQYYITSSPKIIETDITEPIKIDIFDTDTTITTTSTVKPNMYLKSDTIIREALISSGESYYVYAKTTGPVDITLGGVTTRFNPEDIVKQISIPNVNDIPQNIEITGNKQIVTDVMVRKDDRTDIKYFEGLHFVGDPVLVDDVTKYKIKYNIIGGKNILAAND